MDLIDKIVDKWSSIAFVLNEDTANDKFIKMAKGKLSKSLSDKLKLLHYSIRHYRMADVWYQATAGMIERDKREVALQSLSHWKRYAKEVSEYR